MIFIVQINKVPRDIQKYKFDNIRRLQNFSTGIERSLCPSETLIQFSNRLHSENVAVVKTMKSDKITGFSWVL